MEQIQLGDQIIRYDREQTRKAYAEMRSGTAERCGCPYCRNFAVQRSTVYPENFHLILDQFGIDPEKEGEVYETCPEGPLIGYEGWFYLAGELIEAGERLTDAGAGFQYYFRKSLTTPEADFGEDVLALEFSTKLPWVISERP
jgi:hypothetical protein